MNWKTIARSMNWKLIGSSISGILLLAALVVLCFYVGDTSIATAVNLAVIIFGVSIGWIIGIVVSPYSVKEQARFTALSKAVAVFASGYLAAKIDKLVEKLLDPSFALESVHGFRLLARLSAFTLATVITFVYRQYAWSDDDEEGEVDDGDKPLNDRASNET